MKNKDTYWENVCEELKEKYPYITVYYNKTNKGIGIFPTPKKLRVYRGLTVDELVISSVNILKQDVELAIETMISKYKSVGLIGGIYD